jgi:hypothetical protein
MKLLKTILYNDVRFRFISNHYDIHLYGTCIDNNRLCYFKTLDGVYDEEKDEWEDFRCEIYSLNILENIKWRWKQLKFEKCVGYHWSYQYNSDGTKKKRGSFYYRKPEWFYIWLFNKFYKR